MTQDTAGAGKTSEGRALAGAGSGPPGLRPRLPASVMAGVMVGLVCLAADLEAKPDFSGSEIITASDGVVEGGVADFKVVLRNRGDDAAGAQLRIQWPVMGHVVEVSGLSDAQHDGEARVTAAPVSLPAGAGREVHVGVLAPRDAGGAALALTVQLIHYPTMAETWLHKAVSVDTRKRTDGLIIGGMRIAPAGVVTLGWLVATAVAVGIVAMAGARARAASPARPCAGMFGIMIAVGFWLIFAGMAWRDYRVLAVWKETGGTIVGRRITVQSVSTKQRRQTGSGSESPREDVAKPEFAVRYTVDGRTMFSTGYDSGSSLRRGGGRAQLEREFREWTVGAQVPCWYDPADPADVVLKRGFGGAYVFALLPLLPFWLGWSLLRRGAGRGA